MKLEDVVKNFFQVNITYNEHKAYYQNIEEFALENNEGFANVTSNDLNASGYRQRCIDTNTIWIAHVYPRTPVGFFRLCAPTFDELVAAMANVHD